MRKRRVLQRGLALFLVALFATPVLAHPRTIDNLKGGYDGNDIRVYAYLNARHRGDMYITFSVRRGDEWDFVDRKKADKESPRAYTAKFPQQPGDQLCKAKAKFVVNNHQTPRRSTQIYC